MGLKYDPDVIEIQTVRKSIILRTVFLKKQITTTVPIYRRRKL